MEDKFEKSEPFFVSYKIDQEDSVGIFTLNQCYFNKEYRDTVDNFFADVTKNNIKNIIVDLRENTGGNSYVVYYFATYLKNLENANVKKIEIRTENGIEEIENKYASDNIKKMKSDKNLFDGRIFILTSNLTFSSGIMFALEFSDNNLATIVGEVPGVSPTSYGDTSYCGYIISNSKLEFYRIDDKKGPDRLISDVQIPAEDALNKVYELIKSEN